MRKAAVLLLLISAGACRGVGYRRPADRNLDMMGAPSVGVGTGGFDIGRGLAQFPSPQFVAEHETAAGRILASDQSTVTIQSPLGKELRLSVDTRTNVTIDGHRSHSNELPQGADVRAAYVVVGTQQVAEKVEAQTSR
jgi:hypothetical protein